MKAKIGMNAEQDDVRTTALAITLDMGLDWVVQNSVHEDCFDPTEEPGVDRIVKELMHLKHCIMNVIWPSSEIGRVSETYDGDLELLMLRYLVRMLLFRVPVNSWISLGDKGGRAVCEVVRDVILAIPCDLAAARFSRLKRLWSLKPTDVKGVWSIQGKGILQGCSTPEVEDGFVSLARKQTLIAQ
jgi:hypothetical protein